MVFGIIYSTQPSFDRFFHDDKKLGQLCATGAFNLCKAYHLHSAYGKICGSASRGAYNFVK